jgi:hypothetical protein
VWLRKYGPLVVGLPGCLLAGWIELTRALDGHQIAWVYAFEWPFFAVVGTYIWWRTWHPPAIEGRLPDSAHVAAPSTGVPGAESSSVDPELEAWERYLARLHAADPPGEPP